MVRWFSLVSSLAVVCACSGDDHQRRNHDDGDGGGGAGGAGVGGSGADGGTGGSGGTPPATLPLLGDGSHEIDSVVVEVVADATDGLYVPRDLAFHSQRPGELWVVNRGDESVVVLVGADGASPTSQKFTSDTAMHFLAQPSGLAFGNDGRFATIHETHQPTQGEQTPPDFMGPTLWLSNLPGFDAGEASHLDMLHNSPDGMGIAWEKDYVYWVFDGWHSSITRYDFVHDHGPGGTDHSDGIISRYVEGQVQQAPSVPSHMEIDGTALYIADTGNARIAVLDTVSGTPGGNVGPNYDNCVMFAMDGATLTTLVDGGTMGMTKPSGLAVHDGLVFVTDNAASTVYAFTKGGAVVDWLDTGWPAGSLMGMAFDGAGSLYLVDAVGDRVVRVSAP
jgi:hypothetical protein